MWKYSNMILIHFLWKIIGYEIAIIAIAAWGGAPNFHFANPSWLLRQGEYGLFGGNIFKILFLLCPLRNHMYENESMWWSFFKHILNTNWNYTWKSMFHHLCLTWAFRGKCGCCVNTLTNNQIMVGYVYNTYKFLETKTYQMAFSQSLCWICDFHSFES
jgi:hypothetical protein